jgi:hypothetical protein
MLQLYDDFLAEEAILEETSALGIKRVIAWLQEKALYTRYLE